MFCTCSISSKDPQDLPHSAASLDSSSNYVPPKSCSSVSACSSISKPVAPSYDSGSSRDHVPRQSLSLSPCTLSQDSPSLHLKCSTSSVDSHSSTSSTLTVVKSVDLSS